MSDLTHEINFLRREVRDARVISRVIIHRSKLSTSASLPASTFDLLRIRENHAAVRVQ
jgi:hypothetical protein